MRKHIFLGLACCFLSEPINAAPLEEGPPHPAAAVVPSPCFLGAYVKNVTPDNFLYQIVIFTRSFIEIGELQHMIDVFVQDTSLDGDVRASSIETVIGQQEELITKLGAPRPLLDGMQEDWLCPKISSRDKRIAKELYLIAKAEEPDAAGVMRKKYCTCSAIEDALWTALSSIIVGVEPEDINFEDPAHPVITTNPAQWMPVPQNLQAEMNLWSFFMLMKQDVCSHEPALATKAQQASIFEELLKAYR